MEKKTQFESAPATEKILQAALRLIKFSANHTSNEILVETLNEAEVLTGSKIGFCHLLESDQNILSLQAWSTRTTGEMCRADSQGEHYPVDSAGVWVDCIHARKPVIHNDYASLKNKKGMPVGHAAVTRELVVPVFRNDLIVAILGVGNKDTDYSETDVKNISDLADLSWDIAERKRAEEALRESEERWQFAMEGAGDGLWDWNTKTKKVFFSRQWKKMLGYNEDEIGDSPAEWEKRVHPDDVDRVLKEVGRHLEGITPLYTTEHRVKCKDGTYKWILDRGKVITRDSSGKPLRVIGVYTDISEFKRLEEFLRSSEEKLWTIFQVLPVGVALLDHDGKIVQMNPALERILRMPGNDIKDEKYRSRKYLRGDGAPLPQEEFPSRQALNEGRVILDEVIGIVTEDGSTVWTSVSAAPLDTKDIGVLTVTLDITENKNSREILAKSEEKYRSLIELADDVILLTDTNGRHLFRNKAYYSSLGYSGEEELALDGHEYVHPDDLPNVRAASADLIRNGMAFSSYRVRHKNGQWIDRQAKTKVIYDSKHRPEAFMSIIRDITEQKRYEEMMTRNEKLESLGTIAGGIAHDFNNLLGGVFGYLELAENYAESPQVKELLSSAGRTISRARKLTSQLMTFSQGGDPDFRRASLFPFVEDTVRFALAGSSLRCNFHVDPNLWAASYDLNQMSQVIDNITLNARQAAEDSGKYEVTAENIKVNPGEIPELVPGNYVRLSFRDFGRGMNPEILSHIFDPFFTTKTLGSGLGLATSFSIIKRHNGTIRAESVPDRGTVFHLYLPAAGGSTSVEINLNHNTVYAIGSGKILIMDDESEIRNTLRQELILLGYTVETAAEGLEALKLYKGAEAKGSPFDAAILDLTISGGPGGLDVMREIRKNDAKIFLFSMSGYAEDIMISDAKIFGFTAGIPKPFNMEEISKLLSKYLVKS